MTLKLDFFFLSPVEVVKVTPHNLKEVAEWCGGEVATTESRRVAGRMDSYVWVPTPKGAAISWAFPGMFITKRLVRTVKDEMRITFAVFRRDYYEKNYFATPQIAVNETWEKAHRMGLNPQGAKKSQARHPKMAGNPAPLELNVSIPPGSSAEEVSDAMQHATKVLQEQGVLPADVAHVSEEMKLKPNEDAVEAEALKAIAESDVVDGPIEIHAGLSPREVHNAQIHSVNMVEIDASEFRMTADEYKASLSQNFHGQ